MFTPATSTRCVVGARSGLGLRGLMPRFAASALAIMLVTCGFADEPRVINFQAIQTGLKPTDWPVLGSADAPAVLLELFDYTCGSCQQMGYRVHAAREQFGNKLAIIVLPVSLQGPNQQTSRQLARLAMSVFVTDRGQFAGFHEWLLSGRSIDEAHRRAGELIGEGPLQTALQGQQVERYLQVIEQLYTKANRGKLPLLTSDRFTSRGLMQTDQELFRTLAQYHGGQLGGAGTSRHAAIAHR